MKSSSKRNANDSTHVDHKEHKEHKKRLNVRVLICWLLILILFGFVLFCYTLEGFDLKNMEKSLPVAPDEIEEVVAYYSNWS